MSQRLLIPGVEFDFGGGRVYTVPPLSLGAIELMQDRLVQLTTLNSLDPVAVKTMLDTTLLAMRRNYPDMTLADVGELVDVGNVGEVYECLLDAAGVKRRAQEAARGNATAKSPLPGLASSPASVPIPDGPGTTSATM